MLAIKKEINSIFYLKNYLKVQLICIVENLKISVNNII
jgi:hypothetical protein